VSGPFWHDWLPYTISTLPSQPFYIEISMVLRLQRSHMRGAVFDSPEFANSISKRTKNVDPCVSEQRCQGKRRSSSTPIVEVVFFHNQFFHFRVVTLDRNHSIGLIDTTLR
jgi:hypothetical protein